MADTSGPLGRLAELVQGLPRELYDHIFELTFIADMRKVSRRENRAMSHLLRVNSASRKMFAASYFRRTTFCITSWDLEEEPWWSTAPFLQQIMANEVQWEFNAVYEPESTDPLGTEARSVQSTIDDLLDTFPRSVGGNVHVIVRRFGCVIADGEPRDCIKALEYWEENESVEIEADRDLENESDEAEDL